MISLHTSFEYREKEIVDIKFWKRKKKRKEIWNKKNRVLSFMMIILLLFVFGQVHMIEYITLHNKIITLLRVYIIKDHH